MLTKLNLKKFLLSIFLAIAASLFLIFYNKAVVAQGQESYLLLFYSSVLSLKSIKVLLVTFLFAVLIHICQTRGEKFSSFIFKWRFVLLSLIFLVLVCLGISGSSIGCFESATGLEQSGTIAGIPRSIRSDEFNVSTLLALSQYADPQGSFSYFSSIVRGTYTDVFLEYGQPVLDIVEIFRPFHWGYLFLPAEMGLSFYWYGRLILLFIVSFEMGRLITNDKRYLSLIYSTLVTLSPVIQWWFATNGIVEIFIYSQLATLAFKEFLLTNHNLIKRLGCAAVICICVGGYALVMYPPWQIPIAYVILALEIYVFLTYKKEAHISKKELLSTLACASIFVLIFIRVIVLSQDTIISILNTSYPGNRVMPGGGNFRALFRSFTNIFFSIKPDTMTDDVNVYEYSAFIDFFPLPIIFAVYVLLKQKQKDYLLLLMLLVVTVLDIFIIFGFPEIIEKLTLLDKCGPNRVANIVGFPHLILLIRSVSNLKITNKAPLSLLFSIGFGVFSALLSCVILPQYITFKMAIIIFIVFCFLSFFLFSQKLSKLFMVSSFLIFMIFVGGLVNPIYKGLDVIYNNPVLNMVKEVHDKDKSALWCCEYSGSGSLLLTAGAPTINSINVYPNLETWKKLDPDETNYEIYNRYAHVSIALENVSTPKFELKRLDYFDLTLSPKDAKKINIKYFFTARGDLEEKFDTSVISLVAQTGSFRIYEIL